MLAVSPFAVTGGTLGAYFLMYSAYDKASASYRFSNLQKIFGFRSWRFSVVEINKVMGLSALTVFNVGALLGVAALTTPQRDNAAVVLKHAACLGLVHGAFSGVWYTRRFVDEKSVPMWLGVGAVASLCAAVTAGSTAWLAAGTVLSTLHFYVMELGPAGPNGWRKLNVRPAGKVGLLLSVCACAATLFAVGAARLA